MENDENELFRKNMGFEQAEAGRTAFQGEKTTTTKPLEKQKDESVLGKRGIFILVGKQGRREWQVTLGKKSWARLGKALHIGKELESNSTKRRSTLYN